MKNIIESVKLVFRIIHARCAQGAIERAFVSRNNDVARRKESFVRALSLLLTDTLQVKNRREASGKSNKREKEQAAFLSLYIVLQQCSNLADCIVALFDVHF
jgi:hypothetical protein